MSDAAEKRLKMLEMMTQSGNADAFGWYGLAMEYRRRGSPEQALGAFTSLREKFPDYLAQYLMAGQILIESSDTQEAATWLKQGIALAEKSGDGKALGELEAALEECE